MSFLNQKASKSMTSSSLTLLHISSYTLDCFLRMIGSIKMKFSQTLVEILTKISALFSHRAWIQNPAIKTMQNFSQKYCPRLYLLVGQIYSLNDLQIK